MDDIRHAERFLERAAYAARFGRWSPSSSDDDSDDNSSMSSGSDPFGLIANVIDDDDMDDDDSSLSSDDGDDGMYDDAVFGFWSMWDDDTASSRRFLSEDRLRHV